MAKVRAPIALDVRRASGIDSAEPKPPDRRSLCVILQSDASCAKAFHKDGNDKLKADLMQCRQGVTQPRVSQGETALKIEGRFYFPSLVPLELTVRVARSLRSLTLLEEPPCVATCSLLYLPP